MDFVWINYTEEKNIEEPPKNKNAITKFRMLKYMLLVQVESRGLDL